MPYVRIAIDDFQPGAADEVLNRVNEGLVPILKRQPGFLAYDVVRTGDDSAIFINTWETRTQAEAAVQSAAQWVHDNVASRILSVETCVGELALSHRG
jgi:quinol monooxygenase YgiN